MASLLVQTIFNSLDMDMGQDGIKFEVRITYIIVKLLVSCIGSTTSTRRLCDLSSTGKFGRGEAEAKLSQGG